MAVGFMRPAAPLCRGWTVETLAQPITCLNSMIRFLFAHECKMLIHPRDQEPLTRGGLWVRLRPSGSKLSLIPYIPVTVAQTNGVYTVRPLVSREATAVSYAEWVAREVDRAEAWIYNLDGSLAETREVGRATRTEGQ
jgi:hypothetical protein